MAQSGTLDRLPAGHAEIAEIVPLSPMQRMAADHLRKSLHAVVPVTIFADADAGALLTFLGATETQEPAIPVTLTHILVALIARLLRHHPPLNGARVERSLAIYGQVNIGLATALPDGNLIVPVIKNADQLSLGEIAAEAGRLRAAAVAGRVELDDVRGATFTLSNAGAGLNVLWTTPIIPLGQTAILGIGTLRRAPVLRGDDIVAGTLLPLSLTFDHGAINGHPAGRFLNDLCVMTGNPAGAGLNASPA